MSEDGKRLVPLGIDLKSLGLIIYLMLKERINAVEVLVQRLREKYGDQRKDEDTNNSSL